MEKSKRKALIEYDGYCVARDLTVARRIKLLHHVRALLQHTDIKEDVTRQELYNVLKYIESRDRRKNTKRDDKIALRSYLLSLCVKRELIDMVVVGNPEFRIPKKLIWDMTIWQNMKTEEERVLVWTTQRSGGRPGEILNLKYRDIDIIPGGVNLNVNGKTGRRLIPILEDITPLLNYCEKAKSSGDYLFPKSYRYYTKQIKKMLKKKGYPDTYPYVFRKTKATEISENMVEQLGKKFLGWSKNSRMFEIYCFPRQEKLEDAIVRMNKSRGIPLKFQKSLYNWGA